MFKSSSTCKKDIFILTKTNKTSLTVSSSRLKSLSMMSSHTTPSSGKELYSNTTRSRVKSYFYTEEKVKTMKKRKKPTISSYKTSCSRENKEVKFFLNKTSFSDVRGRTSCNESKAYINPMGHLNVRQSK